jgi:hypothetical protein
MSRRLKITLPEALAVQLDELAANADEPVARLAGQMVRHGIAEAAASGQVRQPRVTSALAAHGAPEEASDRWPPWLEPYGGDAECAHMDVGRNRRPVWPLPGSARWVERRLVEERDACRDLCALVVWRQWLDDAGRDPREELAFQVQFSDYGLALRQEGGGVTRAWKPGAAPDEWRY